MKLSAPEKRRIASLGGAERAASLRRARRVAENFRYVRAVAALHNRSVRVIGMTRFEGRLPGIYPSAD